MSHIRKQKPYGSKMEKFDVVGRSRGARNLPINIFIKCYIKQGICEKLSRTENT